MDPIRSIFTKRLRESLSRSGITQNLFASKMKTTTSTVQNWVQGMSWPSSERITEMAEILDCDPVWLVGGPHPSEKTSAVPRVILKMIAEWPDDTPWDQLISIAGTRFKNVEK